MIKKHLLLSVALASVMGAQAEIVTYPAPEGAKLNESFGVEVRQSGDSLWTPVAVYRVYVDEVTGGRHKVVNSSMAYFDFDGTVDVRVTPRGRDIESVAVRPLSYGIDHTLDGNAICFSLDRPRKLSVEINGDVFDNLQLFANGMDTYAPTPRQLKKLRKDKNYVYFAPGYHSIDTLQVRSGQHVHIAGGAVVDGVIEINDARDVRITGHGMVYPHRKMGLRVCRSRNVSIDGPFTTQCAVGESDSVRINNVKLISYYGWGDGFNVFASNNVHYSDVWARTSDDCTTIYATRKGHKGGCRNILTENSVLWADVAHPFMIGLHGSAKELGTDAPADTICDVMYRNIDVLDMKECQIDYQGVFAIVAGDNNYVRDITFDNIRIENFRQGKLFDIRIPFNKKYCAAPGSSISNINFNDITYNGDRSELSLIIGYDEARRISGVHFRNLRINGEKIHDKMPGKPGWYKTSDMARIFVGEHVDDVTFE